MPGEWLPVVANPAGTDQWALQDIDHANRVLELIRQHYNSIAVMLVERPGDHTPLLSIDTLEDRVIWELWMSSFHCAVELRRESWKGLLDADAETANAIRGMCTLA